MKIFSFLGCVFFLSFALTHDGVTDHLKVPGPLQFNNTSFLLAWSEKPNENYYVQEYLPKGDTLEHFNQLLTLSVLITSITPEQGVNIKMAELEERKKTDPTCKYDVVKSPDGKEWIIDFTMGESKDNLMTIAEFNVYRYKQVELKKKQMALVLYSYSTRGYGKNIVPFYKNLKQERNNLINNMVLVKMPKINPQ